MIRSANEKDVDELAGLFNDYRIFYQKEPDIEGGKKFIGDYLGTFNGVVFIEVLRLGGAFDQSPDSYILGLNLETGKKVFEKETDAKYRFYPASLSVMNGGKAYLYGEFFDANANIAKDKSKGFAFWGVDETGKILNEKYFLFNCFDLK